MRGDTKETEGKSKPTKKKKKKKKLGLRSVFFFFVDSFDTTHPQP